MRKKYNIMLVYYFKFNSTKPLGAFSSRLASVSSSQNFDAFMIKAQFSSVALLCYFYTEMCWRIVKF